MQSPPICPVWRVTLLVVIGLLPSAVQAGGDVATLQAGQQYAFYNYTDRVIVKLRSEASAAQKRVISAVRMEALNAAAGVRLAHVRAMSTGAHVLRLPQRMALGEAALFAERLMEDPAVEYAEPDRVIRPLPHNPGPPDDPQFLDHTQWHYLEPANEIGGINLPGAWGITMGNGGLVAAVIDTGLLPHAEIDSNILDMAGRALPGYDFITNVFMANDGDGRDSDPTDPGDATVANDCSSGSPPTNSIWHGTHVAGTIGALTNNATDVAGINWNVQILPVRVLGRCGGVVSDLVDAMLWAAGLENSGAPDFAVNGNPADVINLSLGGTGACTASEQTAIDRIIAAGIPVVVAAGNDSIDASSTAPGNCNGVITVAATNRAGGLASYSNFGSLIEIGAPGGDSPLNTDGVFSTHDGGLTTAANDNAINPLAGTSMATPHVSGVVLLMLAVDAGLNPTQILQKLQNTARTFPTGTGSDCTTSICGAGILDAATAVQSASNATPPTADAGTDQNADPGATVTLDGTGSTANPPAAIATHNWTPPGAVTLNDGTTATPSFTAPNVATGTVLTFQLTVTDDGGLTSAVSTVDVTLNNVAPTVSAGSNPKTAFLGLTLNFNVIASDGNGTTPILNPATGLPAGASYDAATGAFSWPNAGPLGTFNVTFTATDAEAPFPVGTLVLAISVVNPPPPGSVSSSSGSGGLCFIATAAFGSPMAKEVEYLRRFRDQYLLTNRVGQALVQAYYRLSPPVADYIREREWLRSAVRLGLKPLVALSKYLTGERNATSTARSPNGT